MLEEQVRARTSALRATELEIIQRLGQAVESRDEETGEHIERIAALSHRLGLAAGLSADEAELLRRASAMHDVGKIAIPDEHPAQAGPADARGAARSWSATPTKGARAAGGLAVAVVQLGEVIARTHHERWDGTGYPAGLAGEDIPLAGRICAICDVFDALVSARPYKAAVDGRARRWTRSARSERPALRPAARRALPRAPSPRAARSAGAHRAADCARSRQSPPDFGRMRTNGPSGARWGERGTRWEL